ncbi:hypothetical protein ACRYCC_13110 [Actinomadura scrupuli]|uniref:hypothetical protein n=1 Tax=Actinomadura scrupuli TaxID=559629 RepID=UPI003D98BC7D
MPKMTDYVREGFQKRRRPWETAELPEWWNLMVWVGLAVVGGILVVGMILADGSSPKVGQSPRRYAVETLNPYSPTAAPSAPATGSVTGPATAPPAGPGPVPTAFTAADFAATAPAQVPLTGGGSTVVPTGARNVGVAAAKAEATGDWTGIPLAGAAKPPKRARTPGGVVVGQVTVTDPSVTGTNTYMFSATVSHDGGAKPYLVQLTVERTSRGYAIRTAQ